MARLHGIRAEVVKIQCLRAAEHCQARGTNIIKLAMQFATAEPRIPTTLFSTASVQNVVQNVAWIAEPLDEELLAEVRAILKPVFNVSWLQGRPENNQSLTPLAMEVS